MLNARNALKRELDMKSFITSGGLGTFHRTPQDNVIYVSKKGGDEEPNAIEIPQRVWMDTIKGGNSLEALGIAQIQVDQRVVVSNI